MVATRFAVAAHIMVLLARHESRAGGRAAPAPPDAPITSTRLATAVNTNPVVVRRITGQLARAGLIRVRRGPGGATLVRPAHEISLEDVWRAVQHGKRPLLPLHPAQNAVEPGGRAIREALAGAFADAESMFRHALGRTTLATLAAPEVRHAAMATAPSSAD